MLRVGVGVSEPWSLNCSLTEPQLDRSRSCQHPGFCNEILGHLLASLGVPYSVRPLPDLHAQSGTRLRAIPPFCRINSMSSSSSRN